MEPTRVLRFRGGALRGDGRPRLTAGTRPSVGGVSLHTAAATATVEATDRHTQDRRTTVARELEIRRHTDNDGDVLTPDGISNAVKIGQNLTGDFELVVSTGAQRATQTAACILAGTQRLVHKGVHVVTGLRSDREDEWREAYQEAGGGHLDDFQRVASDLVEQDSKVLGDALREVLDRLEDGQRALVIGHSPTNEAAILGLTDQSIDPLGKGDGVLVREVDGQFEVERLPGLDELETQTGGAIGA